VSKSLTQAPDTLPVRPIRRKLREAIRILVTEGCTQREAAQKAGMTEHGLQRALTKPHVQEFRDGVMDAHMTGKTPLAWSVVHKLMIEAASEDVQLKAARTHLDAMGQLTDGKGASDGQARQLIQIITDRVQIGQHPLSERLPGVTEAPPMLDITPSRQTRDESDGSE
jgi:hypothetical protein